MVSQKPRIHVTSPFWLKNKTASSTFITATMGLRFSRTQAAASKRECEGRFRAREKKTVAAFALGLCAASQLTGEGH